MGMGLGGRGTEQKRERTHGHGQQCGICWGGRSTRELNGNRKNTIKKTQKKDSISGRAKIVIKSQFGDIRLSISNSILGLLPCL